MGGSGALLLASTFPGFVRAVAAFSPAAAPGDAVFNGLARIGRTPVGLWCGKDDDLYGNVQELWSALPVPPRAGGFGAGKHNFGYWSTLLPEAFAFLGAALE
jgi:S-formylglutathione hydrolase FrmB